MCSIGIATSPKIPGSNLGHTLLVVVLQVVHLTNVWPQLLIVVVVDLFISGEQDNLMTCEGEVPFDDSSSMGGIKSS